ncbi:putative chromatin regulator PHD family [Helianthus anomalus]
MRSIAMAPARAPCMPMFPPGGPGMGQQMFYGQAQPTFIPPQFKFCKVRSVQFGSKGIPYINTCDGRSIRYPDPLIKTNDTIKLDLESNKTVDFSKFNVGNVVMVTGGRNTGRIYLHKGTVKNLESEVARASKLKCTSCGKKGAVLGCYVKSCQRTYHVPHAYDIPDCRWDYVGKYLCTRASFGIDFLISTNMNRCTTLQDGGKNLVLCGSALSAEQEFMMVDSARTNGPLVSKYWKDNVTHVITATDANGACTRTLKVLMAILNGKWVCVNAGRVVNEEPYEVRLDTHGCSGGPTTGRLRAISSVRLITFYFKRNHDMLVTMNVMFLQAPKLFNKMKFYFVGYFVQAFKSKLLNLVKTAGGTISETMDQLLSSDHGGNEDSIKAQRLAVVEGVARECGSRAVGHTWILESIVACSFDASYIKGVTMFY